MSSAAPAALLALTAGVAGATQIAVQGRLSDRVGTLEAVVTAGLVGAALGLTTLLVVRRSFGGLDEAVAGPKWQLLGGVMSVLIILSITVAGPRIGVVSTTAFLIAAQLSFASVIDRFGWFGIERVPLSWTRVLGVAFLLTGAALTLRK